MKNLSVVILALVLVFGISATAFGADQTNSVTLSPLGFIIGSYNGQYEFAVGDNLGVFVNGSYLNWDFIDANLVMLSGGAGLRYYPNAGFEGFFVQGKLGYGYIKVEDLLTSDVYKGNSFAGGVDAGFKWITGGGFTIEAWVGGAYSVLSNPDTEGEGVSSGFGTSLGLTVGYSF